MKHKGLAAVLVAGALTLTAGGAYATTGVGVQEHAAVTIPLPDSSPTTVAVTINGERHAVQRDGAINQTLHVKVDGATGAALDTGQPDCEGFNVERHMSARLSSTEGMVTITREYTPVASDGTVGEPQTETVASYSAPNQPANIGIDICA